MDSLRTSFLAIPLCLVGFAWSGCTSDEAGDAGEKADEAADQRCMSAQIDDGGFCRASDGTFAPARCCAAFAGDGDVCLDETVSKLPPKDSLGFVEEPCLLWNRDGLEVGDDESVPFDTDDLVSVRHTTLDPLTVAQLRLTLAFFTDMDTSKMTIDELVEAGDGPLFSFVLDKKTGRGFDSINIALGDNPMDMVFKHGTLDPAVVVSDDSVQFCDLD